ncbi:MAG: glycosidase [Clostridiales bacterium 43-6]|nr:MAG: glycosidase [Clostridiales bacterium 43-6]
MNRNTIIGDAVPNMPWEEKPEECTDVVWRSSQNPIIKRNIFPSSNSVFNSAVVPFGDGYAGVFRVDLKTRKQTLHVGFSKDGINWDIKEERIEFIRTKEEIEPFVVGYDPRVCKIDDKYYVTWCNLYKGMPTIGIAYTTNFIDFYQLENAFAPYNRNGVLFPRKIGDNYAMLHRPIDSGEPNHIFYSESPDLNFWGNHRHVLKPDTYWDWVKVGAGPVPIETTEGWLLFYHGVQKNCSDSVYSFGAVILDIDKPWIVKYRCEPYLIAPVELYEMVGDVSMVCFPCATIQDAETGRIAIYYGGADTVVCVAYTQVDELIAFIKNNPFVKDN